MSSARADAPKLLKRAPGRPRPDAAVAHHEHILDVAADLFLRHGYAACSLSMIAEAAGATKPTIYRLCSSKADLFRTAMRRAAEKVMQDVPQISEDRAPEAVLRDYARHMWESFVHGPVLPLWRVVVATAEEFPDLYPEVRRLLIERSLSSRLARYLKKLDAEGDLAIADPVAAAENFSLLTAHRSQLLAGPDIQDFDAVDLEPIIAFFMRGYAPAEKPRGRPKQG